MKQLATLLTFADLVVTLAIVWRQSWPGRLRLFVVQSAVLAALAAALGWVAGEPRHVVLAVVVIVLKCWLIPRALARMVAGTPRRTVPAGYSAGVELVAAGALTIAAFGLLLPVTRGSALPTAEAMPLALAMALIGLFVCVTGRDVFGHILGFLMLENGIFALSLLATHGLSGIVEIGVFLDVLALVVIMEGLVVDVRRHHDSISADRLRELKD